MMMANLTMIRTTPATFDDLPAEVLFEIISNLDTAHDLASVEATCKKLRLLISQNGWQKFVLARFPSISIPSRRMIKQPDWKGFANSLTAQSRAWQKRAIIALELSPQPRVSDRVQEMSSSPSGWAIDSKSMRLMRWDTSISPSDEFEVVHPKGTPINERPAFVGHLRRPQTATFHPTIDSKVEFDGNIYSKQETVAFGTGTDIHIRVQRSGGYVSNASQMDESAVERGNRIEWYQIRHRDFYPGYDDVTSLKLVQPNPTIRTARPRHSVEVDVIAGRASGLLQRFSVSDVSPQRAVLNSFHLVDKDLKVPSSSVSIVEIDVNGANDPLLVAGCSTHMYLYRTESEEHDIYPVARGRVERTDFSPCWTLKFVSPSKLLVGTGPGRSPLHEFEITPSGVVRKVSPRYGPFPGKYGLVDYAEQSVFCIEPIPPNYSGSGSSQGDVFLTGAFDGKISLFDTRTRVAPHEIRNKLDPFVSIHSLAAFGNDRFLAGDANSGLNIFDIRQLGRKAYFHTDRLPCSFREPVPVPTSQRLIREMLPGPPSCRFLNPVQYETDLRMQLAELGTCDYMKHRAALGQCHFHKASRLSIFRPHAHLWLYGKREDPIPQRQAAYSPRNISPILNLSTPSAASPVVFAGVKGRVYELHMTEVDDNMAPRDPYFDVFASREEQLRSADNTVKEAINLSMVEMSDYLEEWRDDPYLMRQTAMAEGGAYLNRIWATERLDCRWEYAEGAFQGNSYNSIHDLIRGYGSRML